MAGTPPLSAAPPVMDASADPMRYWCYHCEKRVSVETISGDRSDIVCRECKNGFVESIAAYSLPPSGANSPAQTSPPPLSSPSFNHQFLQILRLVARAARDDPSSSSAAASDASPPPPTTSVPPADAEDFLRIEFDGWENDDGLAAADDDDADADADFIDEFTRSVSVIDDDDDDGDDNDNDNHILVEEEEEEEEDNNEREIRRQRQDLLRLRIRDFTGRVSGGQNPELDWAEIIRGLEDHTIELRVEVPEDGSDEYIGNPDDYVDAAGYQVLLQNLAENDGSGRRGAPPASRTAVAALPEVVVDAEKWVCAVCKEGIAVGERGMKLPCQHLYHGECIGPWLETRNSCPVCRFELPTDDLEYEEEKRRRKRMV